jgi:glycosyltransferase involved in cell wall biosynthesis
MTSKEAAEYVVSQRRRVLVVIKGLGVGGAEMLIAGAAHHWDRDRFEYRVAFVLPWKDHLVADLDAVGIEAICIGGRRGMSPALFRRLRSVSREVDLVHAHLPVAGISARLVAPVPVVYTEHNLAGSYRALSRWANRLTYGRNSAVIAVSQPVAEALAGYRGPKPRVIPNGVDVAHVGNIRPHKGHRNLIQTARHLQKAGLGIRIVSAGGEKHPGDLDRVRDEADRAGVGDTLAFLGRRRDAATLIAAADVFVNPADVEGLPVAVLEAMMLGTPVVATSVGGVPTVIKHRQTGLLVEPGDPESLAGAVLELLDDRSLASKLADAARALVEEKHGMEPMVRATEQLYEEVLGDV